MSARQGTILFVEDEISLLQAFTRVLERKGHRVLSTSQPDEALDLIAREKRIDLAIMDLQLPIEGSKQITALEAAGGKWAGLILAQELRKLFKRVPIVFWTTSNDRDLRASINRMGRACLIPKSSGADPVLDIVAEELEGIPAARRPRIFIVHGHDDHTMLQLKDYLQNTLGFPAPVVLKSEPTHNKTLIEKLESFTNVVDFVIVLLTPDDRMAEPGEGGRERFLARQNVIFELGYFMGVLGRNTGRVILLYRRPTELPSDIGGIIAIDISDGIRAADAEIRRELGEWL